MRRATVGWMRVVGVLSLLMLVVPLLASGAQAQDGGEKVLRIHQPLYPDVIDPQVGSALAEISIWALNYESLTRLDDQLQTVPGAAESWEFNADLTQITFHLRDGLKYSDGAPLTAENFRYAAERTCDPYVAGGYQYVLADIVVGCEEFAALNPGVEEGTPVAIEQSAYEQAKANLGVRTLDDATIQFDLKAPAPYFPTVASLWVLYPARQDLIGAGGSDWWKDPTKQIGNGPFQVVQMDEQQLVAFEPNPQYWGGQPKLSRIEYVYIPDSQTALEAYQAGQIDIFSPDSAQLPAIEGDATLAAEFIRYASANTWYLNYNLTQKPFDDFKVREAFSLAFDRQTYCDAILGGTCVPAQGWVPQDVPGAIQSDKLVFDPEAAKAALAASSYGGPENLPEIKYYYNSDDPLNQPRVEWIAGQFRDILGVEVTLEPTDGTTLSSMRRDPKTYPQLSIYNWYQDYPDAQNWLSVYWTCSSRFAQRVGYCNPEFDKLTEQGDTAATTEERVPFYQQAGEILIQDLPGPPLFHAANFFLVKPSVTGYTPTSIDGYWPGERVSALTIDVTK
ncbi:MAG: oligopeptide transport system substrate-binding protein [Thermomicrobiales bacterium]|nr:oligopeptide transport system substrate-binding protein [Thermomicrobiales bacterium]